MKRERSYTTKFFAYMFDGKKPYPKSTIETNNRRLAADEIKVLPERKNQ